MRNLLNILLHYSHCFVFVLLEAVALLLLFQFNRYQQSVFFTSASAVTGCIYEGVAYVKNYFHLKEINEGLLERNLWLEKKMIMLEQMLNDRLTDGMDWQYTEAIDSIGEDTYRVVAKAHVVKNSLTRTNNYITIDKGADNGIRPDMGVVDTRGVVGIVYKTSARYSLIISLLNSKSNLSSKIIGSDYFGYVRWEGGDAQFAYLEDLPRHAAFDLGDTVVTSGYSTVFPPGIMVGTVDDITDSQDGLSFLLKIRLATDFGKVNNVRVIERKGQEEELELEKVETVDH